MVRQHCIALLTVAMLTTFSAAQADKLIIENIDTSGASLSARPNRGMSMDTVTAKWGQPDMTRSAVGEPPITRWEYPGFIVYFEYGNVIHTVVNR